MTLNPKLVKKTQV